MNKPLSHVTKTKGNRTLPNFSEVKVTVIVLNPGTPTTTVTLGSPSSKSSAEPRVTWRTGHFVLNSHLLPAQLILYKLHLFIEPQEGADNCDISQCHSFAHQKSPRLQVSIQQPQNSPHLLLCILSGLLI
jgi:hypothetical protein